MREDIKLVGTDPIAAGRFGEVWKGTTSNNEIIAVKILRVYEKSDAEKLLKVFYSSRLDLLHLYERRDYRSFPLKLLRGGNYRTRMCYLFTAYSTSTTIDPESV